MHDTHDAHGAQAMDEMTEQFIRFYRKYYRDELGRLAQRYPSEQRALRIDYSDLVQFEAELAEGWLDTPEQMHEYADAALHNVDLPADVSLTRDDAPPAEVRLTNLPEDREYYPGGYSPSDAPGEYVAIRGEIAMATDTYPKIVDAAFECQRCGTMTYIPQDDGYQEPHECQGCERQGPFHIDFDQSVFVDAQSLRVQEPPSVAGGEGATVDVFVEEDLAGRADTGDEVVFYGTLHLRQVDQDDTKFTTYLDARAVQFEESSSEDLDITTEERQRIRDLAAGAEGDPLQVAADALVPKIHGYEHVKKAAILQLVGGEHVEYANGATDRGDIHLLAIGDPSTGKSEIVDAVERVAPRAAAVSASNTGKAGMTASAVRDDFGDGEWTLKPGAFAKANGGMVCVEELDDLEAEKRAAMLEPMSKQSIAVSKAGINTKLQTRVGVIAAANPKHGRFDPYEPVAEQFVFGSAMLSRFDLIFTFTDEPNPDSDTIVAGHIAGHRREGKLQMREGQPAGADAGSETDTSIDHDLLRKWVALASRSDPPISDETALEDAQETFVSLRGANGYDENDPVPVTWRSWEAVLRIAEAAAKFEFSATIEARHFETATQLVGQSMQDIGKNEDGELDADVVETGTSKPQAERKKTLKEILKEEAGGTEAEIDRIVDVAADHGISEQEVNEEIQTFRDSGWVIEPRANQTVKWVGEF
ncbi:minichromosome maintenance protein MCM [Halobellus sp. H-GB7]|uniref:minichromosome maintenance protein MCM n=1 Tax=Halobellus sp. H-GB7 TaxID=3069756 RepID=UPI0027B2FA97|nr:minichromosome maintenance protein MCM [Halobellus sp. H-GB7]MDQ2053263.1 minichromosome maintenance protein MCM [Halobellus sp. H-GB7]